MIRKICKAIDLKEDQELIKAYQNFHKPGNVPSDVLRSIQDEGFVSMEIYRVDNRLFMLAMIDDKLATASGPEKKSSVVIEWDRQMSQLQLPLKNHESWCDMQKIFDLSEHTELLNKETP